MMCFMFSDGKSCRGDYGAGVVIGSKSLIYFARQSVTFILLKTLSLKTNIMLSKSMENLYPLQLILA